MSAKFRGVGGESAFPGGMPGNGEPKSTRILGDGLDNNAYSAAAEHPPALKISIGLIELLWGCFCNVIQVTTSTIGIMSMILTGGVVALTNVGDLAKAYPWIFTLAIIIAGGIQVVLHMNA